MKLGYVLSRYPLLSETFILREMWELERQGQQIAVYPLRPAANPGRKSHPRAQGLRARVWRARWLEAGSHAYWLRRRPLRYLATWAQALWHNRGDFNLELGALAYWGKAAAIARQAQRDQIDQMHAHYATHPALVAWVVGRLTGIRYSFTVHAHDLFCHRAMLGQKIAGASAVVAISAYNWDRLEAARPQGAATPIRVVHCGVEMPPGRRGRRRAGRELRIVSVGSLQAYKGHRYLIEACDRLRRRGVGFACRIVGGGRLEATLRGQIARLGLEDWVQLAGAATEEEVAAELERADVFALPSVRMAGSGQMEGIPVALMEAMAAELPVVASRLSGIPELVRDGVEGWLVRPGDAAALADGLMRLRDADLRARMGEAGRARIEAEFSLAASITQLLAGWGGGARREVAA